MEDSEEEDSDNEDSDNEDSDNEDNEDSDNEDSDNEDLDNKDNEVFCRVVETTNEQYKKMNEYVDNWDSYNPTDPFEQMLKRCVDATFV